MRSGGRRWLELGACSPSATELEPLLAEGLLALGGRAVQESGGWYLTYLEEPAASDAFLERARATLADVVGGAPVEIRTRWVDHEDWAESWKKGLAPRRIGSRLVVTTTWHPVAPHPGDLVVVIDPGMAFGTAEHGTTRGCLRLLERTVAPGERILDVGAGSGILAIAAARLGAEVLALEGDSLAVEALAENVALNTVADRVRWERRWVDAALLASYGPRDGVVANLESGVLKLLLEGLAAVVRSGGWLILSGILESEWPEVRKAVEAGGFGVAEVEEDGEWRSALMRRAG